MKISGRREDKKATAIIGRIRKDVGAYWGFAVVFVLYDIAAHAMFHAFCPSVFLFGLPCPGCGMTRAVFFFITGQFQKGMQMNPLGLLWILWAAYLVVMRYGFGKKAKGLMTAAGVIVVLMVAVYLYRMYCFFPGEPPISYTSGSGAAYSGVSEVDSGIGSNAAGVRDAALLMTIECSQSVHSIVCSSVRTRRRAAPVRCL